MGELGKDALIGRFADFKSQFINTLNVKLLYFRN